MRPMVGVVSPKKGILPLTSLVLKTVRAAPVSMRHGSGYLSSLTYRLIWADTGLPMTYDES